MDAPSTEVDHEIDYLSGRLQPLFTHNQPVALQLYTARGIGKRKDPIITLTPGSSFGWPREWIVVSVINNGSCILKLNTKQEAAKIRRQGGEASPRIADLVLAGIPAKLAYALVTHLQTLVWSLKSPSSQKSSSKNPLSINPQESHHGNSTHTSTGTGPRRPRKSRCTPFRESSPGEG